MLVAVRSDGFRTYDGSVFGLFVILFLVIPVVEIYIIVQVGSIVGGWNTIGIMILVSVVGAWMVRREGLSIIAKVQHQLAEGSLPTKQLVDGLLVALAGALMLTPGFLTDGIGLLLLLPPTRAIARTALIARFRGRIQVGGAFSGPPAGFTGRHPGFGTDVYDVGEADYTRADDSPDPPIELDP